jgi:hypothetical protein
MAFKDNLIKKIEIKALSLKVTNSIGGWDSGKKIDRKAMGKLLAMTNFTAQRVRDLDLYVRLDDTEKQDVLVLDNELAFYRTTVEDVVLRKSPTIKEMISIRNAIKILDDKDVVLTRRSDTVERIRDELIDALDLSYTVDDVAAIVGDGVASLQKEYGDGVSECLMLLAEMLGYQKAPKTLALKHYIIWGALDQHEDTKLLFGPSIIYSCIHNTLRWVNRQIDISNRGQIKEYHETIISDVSSDKVGERVLKQIGSLIKNTGIIDNN